jgi:TolB-like protein
MPTDIFISYASEDRDRIHPLVDALQRHGWTVWWDREIVPGADFARRIEAAIAAARCVVVVWTEASVDSTWVQSEALEGLERRILVPVRLDPVSLPLAFRHKNAAQLHPWTGDDSHPEFQRLLRGIEETLSGIPSPSDTPFRRVSPPASRSRFTLPGILILAVAIALAATTSWWLARSPVRTPSAPPPNSIAVLRLANLSSAGDTYRSDGLSLELLSLLTRVKEIVVASQTSSFAIGADTTEIGERLGVRYFVEGSFNRTGEDITVDLRLVDAGTHHVVWSDRLKRGTESLIDIPFEAARGIVTSFDIVLSDQSLQQLDARPTENPAALDQYLRGSQLLRTPANTWTLS